MAKKNYNLFRIPSGFKGMKGFIHFERTALSNRKNGFFKSKERLFLMERTAYSKSDLSFPKIRIHCLSLVPCRFKQCEDPTFKIEVQSLEGDEVEVLS